MLSFSTYCLASLYIFINRIGSLCFGGQWLFICISTFHSSSQRTLTNFDIFCSEPLFYNSFADSPQETEMTLPLTLLTKFNCWHALEIFLSSTLGCDLAGLDGNTWPVLEGQKQPPPGLISLRLDAGNFKMYIMSMSIYMLNTDTLVLIDAIRPGSGCPRNIVVIRSFTC